MTSFTQYDGHFVNHAELLHRPGELELAVQLFEVLGFTAVDISKDFGSKSTYMGVFADGNARDSLNNVLYLTEIREQPKFEQVLKRRMQQDDELRAAFEAYEQSQRKLGNAMHFGLRYPGLSALQKVLDRLQHGLPAELAGRVTLYPQFSIPLPALGAEVVQAFIHTDVIGGGAFPFGQLIELQAQRAL
jgi:hypothetical protein